MKLICPNGHENPHWAGFGVRRPWRSSGITRDKRDVNLSKFRKVSSRILTGLELG
jgi:hypothetical protein